MKPFFTTLLLVSFVVTTIFGQKLFQTGELTLRSGEQLTGYLFVDNIDRGKRELLYKASKDAAERTYSPDKVSSFQLNGRRYVVRNVEETHKNGNLTRVFRGAAYLEQLEGGRLNLYQYRGTTDNWLYVETPNQQFVKLILQRYYPDPDDRTKILQRDTMGTTKFKSNERYNLNKIYIRQLQQLTQGCAGVQISPKKLALKAPEVRRVIRAYNECNQEQFPLEVFKAKKLELYGLLAYAAQPLFSDSDSLFSSVEVGGEVFFSAVTRRIGLGINYSTGEGFLERPGIFMNAPTFNPVKLRRIIVRINYYPLSGRRFQPYGSFGFSYRNYRAFFRGREFSRFEENGLFLALGGQVQLHSRVKASVEVGYPYFPVLRAGIGIRIF